jgi:hypothetical protein
MTHPVEIAIAPLKADAIADGEKRAVAVVARHRAGLEAVGMDQEQWAPYPCYRTMAGHSYFEANRKYRTCSALVEWTKPTLRPREPVIVRMVDAKIAKFVQDARDTAAQQYDMFVAKLVRKIGECESATLDGNHVWSHSVLTVGKAGGVVERWKTQQIINFSKLGLAFPQWPSRKVK